MRSIRIALDARLAGGDFTGDSTYWTGLLHGLAELDSPLEFLLFSNGERPAEIPESPRFRWIRLKSSQSRWWSWVKFPLAARQMGAHAIHTQYNLSPLVGKKGITTIHDVSFFIGPQWFKPRDLFLLGKFVPASARRAAKVITVSESSKSEICRYIPAAKSKTEVVSLAANPRIKPIPAIQARNKVADELGISDPFLLSVGTRWPRKNMALAVEASRLLSSGLPHRLALTGKPGWGEEKEHQRVVKTGFVSVDQLSALYSAADLYLAPSFHEGFGIPLIEAFLCGCPVLCSSGGALPEVAGRAARVMLDWEPNTWAAAIEELLGDSSKLDAMREEGKRRAAEFSWRKCAEMHERVYKEVAG